MKITMMVLGGLLIVFGLVDLLGSFANFDLWGIIGIRLPDMVWQYSAYIEMIVGYVIFKFGGSFGEGEAVSESESA